MDAMNFGNDLQSTKIKKYTDATKTSEDEVVEYCEVVENRHERKSYSAPNDLKMESAVKGEISGATNLSNVLARGSNFTEFVENRHERKSYAAPNDLKMKSAVKGEISGATNRFNVLARGRNFTVFPEKSSLRKSKVLEDCEKDDGHNKGRYVADQKSDMRVNLKEDSIHVDLSLIENNFIALEISQFSDNLTYNEIKCFKNLDAKDNDHGKNRNNEEERSGTDKKVFFACICSYSSFVIMIFILMLLIIVSFVLK